VPPELGSSRCAPVSGANGELVGLVTAAIELQSIEEFFATIALARTVQSASSTMTAKCWPASSCRRVHRPSDSERDSREMASDADRHVVRITSVIRDGEDRIIAAHRVAHYPLVVAASASIASILADWKREAAFWPARAA